VIGTPMVLTVFDKNSQKTVKTAKMTIGVPIITASASGVRRIHKALKSVLSERNVSF